VPERFPLWRFPGLRLNTLTPQTALVAATIASIATIVLLVGMEVALVQQLTRRRRWRCCAEGAANHMSRMRYCRRLVGDRQWRGTMPEGVAQRDAASHNERQHQSKGTHTPMRPMRWIVHEAIPPT
jgi:hypothetical protein